MELKRIQNKDYDYFYSLLENDFCHEERKAKQREFLAFSHPNFRPNFIYEKGKIIGYFCFWDFDSFIFGEHFAILKELRDLGNGARFLKEFLKDSKKLIIFEIENPITKQAKRRINFYKRLGFCLNDYNYIQPSYHETEDAVPLIISSYPRVISEKEYKEYMSIVKKEVYDK